MENHVKPACYIDSENLKAALQHTEIIQWKPLTQKILASVISAGHENLRLSGNYKGMPKILFPLLFRCHQYSLDVTCQIYYSLLKIRFECNQN
ncbi:MAG: hypothetical protein DRI57_11665 [Deltaproteobacteria bacterium]|nr:MAG: hypothetical protein DRI57_11665 [Deltaproteobacteria bacterium]